MNNITIIAALSANKVIGVNGKLPWRLTKDLRLFKIITTDNVVVMGRKTFESIGNPLPNRINIVISRQVDYAHEGIHVVPNITDALELANSFEGMKTYIIGGAEIYKQTIDIVSELILTEVDTVCEGDAFFPDIPPEFKIENRTKIIEEGSYTFNFTHYTKDIIKK